jgi:hypothetical protein
MEKLYCPKCLKTYELDNEYYYCRDCFLKTGINAALQKFKYKFDDKQMKAEDKLLKTRVEKSMKEHLQLAKEYEKGRNIEGARQLRAVANLLGVLLVGGIPSTICQKIKPKKQ